ncbi:MAG: DUF2341 domain-containing protein, partial [Candidatus Omnitrophica bacterium]|nr:DUF2341 domain-containing protein [Candidatus Omnitrophota bacterium]
ASNDLTISAGELQAGVYSIAVSNNLSNKGKLICGANSITVGGNLTNEEGTFTAGTTLDVGGDFSLVSGTFTAPANFYLAGNWINSGGTFIANSGMVIFDGTDTQTLTAGSSNFYHLVISNSSTQGVKLNSDTLIVTNQLDIVLSALLDLNGIDLTATNAGFENQGFLQLRGYEITAGLDNDTNSGTVRYAGDGDSLTEIFTIKDFGLVDYYNLEIADSNIIQDVFSSGSDLNIAGNLNVSASTLDILTNTLTTQGSLTVDGGILTAVGGNISAAADVFVSSGTLSAPAEDKSFTVAGNWTRTQGVFTHNNGTVTFDAVDTDNTITSGASPFNNIEFAGQTGEWTLQDTLYVDSGLSIKNGTLNSGANNIEVTGNWANTAGSSGFIPQTSTIIFNASDTDNMITSGGATFYDLEFNNAAGLWLLSDGLGASNDLTISAGELQAGVYSIAVSNNLSNKGKLICGANSITVGANLTNYGTALLGSSLDVEGNFSLTSGEFTAPTNFYLAGDFTNSGGTFTANSGTVIFDNVSKVSTISGSTAFYNFTCATPGKTLKFEAEKTQTIEGTLTLEGETRKLIVLRSTVGDEQFTINSLTTQTVNFVDVKDSIAVNDIFAHTSKDSGNNNLHWIFTATDVAWWGLNSTDWAQALNWQYGYVPNKGDNIFIDVGSPHSCVLDTAREVNNLTINLNGLLDLDGNNLIIMGGFENEGTLMLAGNEYLGDNFINDTNSGTVQYYGKGYYTKLAAGNKYYDLIIATPCLGPYRRTISLTNYRELVLNNYQVKVTLNSANFDFSNSTSDGRDLRFLDSDEVTLLNYWVESWDKTNEAATVWVKVPSIPQATRDENNSVVYANKGIYMYYGDLGLASVSEARTTMVWYDDFEQSLINYQHGGTSGWMLTTNSYQGNKSAGSNPNIEDYEDSSMQIAFSSDLGLQISFYDSVSSEAGGDYLRFYINGSQYHSISGSADFAIQEFTLSDISQLYSRSWTLKWNYTKNGADTSGLDRGWIDDLVIRKYVSQEPGLGVGDKVLVGNFSGDGSFLIDTDTFVVNNNLIIQKGSLNLSQVKAEIAGNVSVATGARIVFSQDQTRISGNLTNKGMFSHSSGTVIFDSSAGGRTIESGASRFCNLEFNGTDGVWTLQDSLGVDNNLTITAGKLAAGSNIINIAGNWTNNVGAAGFDSGTGTVIFDTASKVSIITGDTKFTNFTCATADKTLKFEASSTQTITGSFILTGGEKKLIVLRSTNESGTDEQRQWYIDPQGSRAVSFVDVKDSYNVNTVDNGGDLVPRDIIAEKSKDSENNTYWGFGCFDLTWEGDDVNTPTDWATDENWDLGYVPNPSDNIIVPNVPNKLYLDKTRRVNHLTILSGGVVDLGGYGLTLTGTFINQGILKLKGNEALLGFTNYTTVGTVQYYGSDLSYAGLAAKYEYYNLEFCGSATYNIDNPLKVYNNLEVQAGKLVLTAQTNSLGVDNNLIISGGELAAGLNTVNIGGSFTNSGTFTTSGTVVFDALNSNETITCGGTNFNDLEFNGSGSSWALGDSLDVDGDLIVAAGTLAAGANPINIAGSFTNTGSLTHNNITITFDGQETGKTIKSGSLLFYNLIFDGQGEWTLQEALAIDNNLIISSGSLVTGNSAVTISGSLVNRDKLTSPGNSITVGNNFTNEGIFTAAAGSSLDVNGNWAQTLGSFTAPGNFYLAGDFINFGGAFIHNNGTVTFDTVNTGQILGSTEFYNLTCAAAGKTLEFEAGSTQKVQGILTLEGEAGYGKLVYLRSTVSGEQWKINPTGTVRNVSFVDVKNSTNVNEVVPIIAATSCDRGDNFYWEFSRSTLTWTGAQDTDWGKDINWNYGYVPNEGDNVIIAAGAARDAVLDKPREVNELTIESGRSFDLKSNDFSLTGVFANRGTLKLEGYLGQITWLGNDKTGGTIEYHGNDNYAQLAAGNDYYNLTINSSSGSGVFIAANDLNVYGDFTLSRGAFTAPSGNFSLAGDFTLAAGATYTHNSGILNFTGTEAATITDLTASPQNLGKVVIDGTTTLPGTGKTVSTSSNVQAAAVTIGADDTLNITGDTLTLTATGTPLVNNGSFITTDSTVIYTSSGSNTNIAAVKYHNLILEPTSATTYLLSGSLSGSNALTGSLTIKQFAALDADTTNSYNLTAKNITIEL